MPREDERRSTEDETRTIPLSGAELACLERRARRVATHPGKGTHCPRIASRRVYCVFVVVPLPSSYVLSSPVPSKFMHVRATVRAVASYFRAQVHAHVRLSTTTTNSGWNSATILGNL